MKNKRFALLSIFSLLIISISAQFTCGITDDIVGPDQGNISLIDWIPDDNSTLSTYVLK